jgi:mono/diheme cytochrome c family protein
MAMVSGQSRWVKELRVIRISALTFALLAAAQTNIDQGKSASQIFPTACVDCHKAPRGLAAGKNS